jgi:hypothetical protein
MSVFGLKGECPECGRDIGLIEGKGGLVLRYHVDKDGDGLECPGRGQAPKPVEPTEA